MPSKVLAVYGVNLRVQFLFLDTMPTPFYYIMRPVRSLASFASLEIQLRRSLPVSCDGVGHKVRDACTCSAVSPCRRYLCCPRCPPPLTCRTLQIMPRSGSQRTTINVQCQRQCQRQRTQRQLRDNDEPRWGSNDVELGLDVAGRMWQMWQMCHKRNRKRNQLSLSLSPTLIYL